MKKATSHNLQTRNLTIEEIKQQMRQQLAEVDADLPSLNVNELDRVISEVASFGPLDTLILDPSITEILVCPKGLIWYEAMGHLAQWHDHFLTPVSERNILQRIFTEANIELNIEHPFADSQWRQFRLHAIAPPVSNTIQLSLRRHPDNPWRLKSLVAEAWATDEEARLICRLIEDRQTLLVIGPTSSGKTSVLNACLQEVAANERCLLIEDTAELNCPNNVSARLLTRRDPKRILSPINQQDLVIQSLRMRPDRLIMGEIRGAEAKDLLLAFSTGHSGGMATLHAETPRQALIRLEMLIQLGCPGWSLTAIRQLIQMSITHILVTGRGSEGHRRLLGLYRLSSLEETGFTLEQLSPYGISSLPSGHRDTRP